MIYISKGNQETRENVTARQYFEQEIDVWDIARCGIHLCDSLQDALVIGSCDCARCEERDAHFQRLYDEAYDCGIEEQGESRAGALILSCAIIGLVAWCFFL